MCDTAELVKGEYGEEDSESDEVDGGFSRFQRAMSKVSVLKPFQRSRRKKMAATKGYWVCHYEACRNIICI